MTVLELINFSGGEPVIEKRKGGNKYLGKREFKIPIIYERT
jgi:hypothetical protein